MKALSLWQPWASAVALGLKRHETRGQDTRYRGELAICATRTQTNQHAAMVSHDARVALSAIGVELPTAVPHGCCVAVATLAETLQVVDPQELRRQGVTVPSFVFAKDRDHWHRVVCWSWARSRPEWLELSPADFLLGDYSYDRWVYVLRDVRALVTPVHVRGSHGVFALDEKTHHAIADAEKTPVAT